MNQQVEYSEQYFPTTNRRLAATLLSLGAKLRDPRPLQWDDVWPSREAYLAGKSPRTHVTFIFEGPPSVYKASIDAYRDAEAVENFERVLNDQGLSEHQKRTLLDAHGRAVIRACRELFEAVTFLIKLKSDVPEDAKWDVILGDGNGQTVRLGKNSSDELREEYLSLL
jgi:hypothetical protein